MSRQYSIAKMGNGDGVVHTADLAASGAGYDHPGGGGPGGEVKLSTPLKRARRRERGAGVRIREPMASGSEAEAEPLNKEGKQQGMLGVASAFNLVRKVSDRMSSKKQGKLYQDLCTWGKRRRKDGLV